MRYWMYLTLLVAPFSIQASSVRLQNESHYDLKAMIRAADGSVLAEVDVKSQETLIWSDTSISRDSPSFRSSSKSMTPFSVVWFCESGDAFCSSPQVTNGSLVRTSLCTGNKVCIAPKKE